MEQRVVMVNLVQCWQCKRYIPPGEEIRARVMRTAVAYGSGRSSGQMDRYEPVSLCGPCDTAAAVAYEVEQARGAQKIRWLGWALGGFWMTVALRTLNLSLPLAALGAVVLAKMGILGRSVLLIAVAQAVIEIAYGQSTAERYQPFFVSGALAAMVVAKCGWWIVRWSQQRRLTRVG